MGLPGYAGAVFLAGSIRSRVVKRSCRAACHPWYGRSGRLWPLPVTAGEYSRRSGLFIPVHHWPHTNLIHEGSREGPGGDENTRLGLLQKMPAVEKAVFLIPVENNS